MDSRSNIYGQNTHSVFVFIILYVFNIYRSRTEICWAQGSCLHWPCVGPCSRVSLCTFSLFWAWVEIQFQSPHYWISSSNRAFGFSIHLLFQKYLWCLKVKITFYLAKQKYFSMWLYSIQEYIFPSEIRFEHFNTTNVTLHYNILLFSLTLPQLKTSCSSLWWSESLRPCLWASSSSQQWPVASWSGWQSSALQNK